MLTVLRFVRRNSDLLHNRRASVAIVAATVLPVLIALVALVGEAGLGLIEKTENQRAADISAFAAGLTYASGGSTAAITAAAQNIAALNGVSASLVSASVTASPRTSSRRAIAVNITSTENLLLAPIMGTASTLTVASNAYAEIESPSPACIVALGSSGTGVTLSGSAVVSAPNCAVSSNTTMSVPCGSTISAMAVTYDSSAQPGQPCTGINTTVLKNAASADPLVGNSAVALAVSRLAAAAALAPPLPPVVLAGGPINFGSTAGTTAAQAIVDGCFAALAGSTWTVTCPQGAGSSYSFGRITVASGLTVNFNSSGATTTTYNFSGSIGNVGSALNFGPGIYNIAQGIATSAAATIGFGAGTFAIGQGVGSCNGGGAYSICNTGTSLTFAGPSSFALSAGIYNATGATLTMGSGSTNSFAIGASSDGNALYAAAGSATTLADATGNGNVFQLSGNVAVAGGSGVCIALGAAAQHDINGYLSLAGGTSLGAGIYTATGYIAFGETGAGDVTCNGANLGVSASGVTLVAGASTTPAVAPCYHVGFCVAGGYTNVALTAPTTGPTAYLLMIGPTTAANIAGGASNTALSGIVYAPYGPVTMANTGSIGGSGCLEIVGESVTQSGGTTNASTCLSVGGGSLTVALVQ